MIYILHPISQITAQNLDDKSLKEMLCSIIQVMFNTFWKYDLSLGEFFKELDVPVNYDFNEKYSLEWSQWARNPAAYKWLFHMGICLLSEIENRRLFSLKELDKYEGLLGWLRANLKSTNKSTPIWPMFMPEQFKSKVLEDFNKIIEGYRNYYTANLIDYLVDCKTCKTSVVLEECPRFPRWSNKMVPKWLNLML